MVGPDPPVTLAAPAPADRPDPATLFGRWALSLAVLSAVGAGWVVRLGGGPRWLRLALAPAIGVALLVPTCLLVERVGIRVGGIGGAFVVVALAGAGLVAAIVGREAEEEAPAPDGALPCSGPRPPAHEGEHRPVTTRNEAIDILDAGHADPSTDQTDPAALDGSPGCRRRRLVTRISWAPLLLGGEGLEALAAWDAGERAPIDRDIYSTSINAINGEGVRLRSRHTLARVQRDWDNVHGQLIRRSGRCPTRGGRTLRRPAGRSHSAIGVGQLLVGKEPFGHEDAHVKDLAAFVEDDPGSEGRTDPRIRRARSPACRSEGVAAAERASSRRPARIPRWRSDRSTRGCSSHGSRAGCRPTIPRGATAGSR